MSIDLDHIIVEHWGIKHFVDGQTRWFLYSYLPKIVCWGYHYFITQISCTEKQI